LIKLRYKLMWAKTRSRNGRIALFMVGYLLVVLLIALLAAGGLAAGIVAIRAGQGERIVQTVLFALFLQAVFASNIMGFGLNAIFSDTELRRYPLSALDRRLARHLIGIADPFWFFFLALEFGLAVGISVMGAGSFWRGTVAVLLLFVCNYLFANVVALFVDRLMQRKGGAAIMLALILVLSLGPSLLAPVLKKNPAIIPAVVERLQYTPPFGAAAAIVRYDVTVVYGFITIVAWIAGLVLLLIMLEKRAPQRQAAASVKMNWESVFDQAGAFFGPRIGPFVGHWLRFYLRNNRTRLMVLISLPLLAFITVRTSERLGPHGLFVASLGTFPMATFMFTSRIAVNQFGYVGGAFRRYLLLPIEPADIVRSASYASMALGAVMLLFVLLAWIAFAPGPFDARMLVMLACSGITGLFVFNALGIWITLFNPRRGKYNSSFGNDLSLGGNIVVVGGVISAFFLPTLLYRAWPEAVSPDFWWMILPLPLFAAAFYIGSLKAAGSIFTARREKLLAVVEGKA
jgi:hypothetical protein